MGSVVGQEFAEHALTSARWSQHYGRLIEESTELLGALLILSGAVYHHLGRRWSGPLSSVVPDPMRLGHLFPILIVGLIAHLATPLLLLLAPDAGPSKWYGIPAAIFPVVVFFVLACNAYWVPRREHQATCQAPEVKAFWNVIALFFLACSLGFMQNFYFLLWRLIPGTGRAAFYDSITLYFVLIPTVWFFALSLRRTRPGPLVSLLALLVVPVIDLHLGHATASYLAAGIFAFLCSFVFLWPIEPINLPASQTAG
jgi:hypothetical protein